MATATVKTRLGEVRGSQADGIYCFKGIPCAAPSFGADRFRPPQSRADAIHAAWVAFATNVDPGWPEYALERRPSRWFDTRSGIVDDPHHMERAR